MYYWDSGHYQDPKMAYHIPLGVMGNVHKSVDECLYPLKMTLPSDSTSHLLLSKITQQPALQSGRILTSNANAKSVRMCPIRTVGRSGTILQTCVDFTLHPWGRLIVNGLDATCLFASLMPSMTKMDVAPMSAIACNVAIVLGFKALCEVGPNNAQMAMAHACGLCVCTLMLLKEEQFDVTTVMSLSHLPKAKVKAVLLESREVKVFAVTKLINLYAIFFSAPPCQAEQY
jgi:hypothetical protein